MNLWPRCCFYSYQMEAVWPLYKSLQYIYIYKYIYTWCHPTHWENKVKSTWICDSLVESVLTHDLSLLRVSSILGDFFQPNNPIVKRTQNRNCSSTHEFNGYKKVTMVGDWWKWLLKIGPSSIEKEFLTTDLSVVPNLLTCRSCCRPWFAECSWHIWGWTAEWSLGFEPTKFYVHQKHKIFGHVQQSIFMLCRWSLLRYTGFMLNVE